jgi:hypothetical protein
MAKRIETGSLVTTNRKVAGLGLVVERVKDVNLYANFDLSEAFRKVYDTTHPEYFFKGRDPREFVVNERNELIASINLEIIRNNPKAKLEVLEAFWDHNRAYSRSWSTMTAKKPKTDFCLIKWLRAPSDYDHMPSKWYKKQDRWMITTAIKNKT